MVFTARHENLRTGAVHRPFVFDIYKLFYYVYFSSLWLFTILGPVSNPYRELNKNTNYKPLNHTYLLTLCKKDSKTKICYITT